MNEAIEALVSIIETQKKNIGTSYEDALNHSGDYQTFWSVGEALWKVIAPMQSRTFIPLYQIDVGEAAYRMAVDMAYQAEQPTEPPQQLAQGDYLSKYIDNLKIKHNSEVGLEDAEHTREDVEKTWGAIINPPSLNQEEEGEDEDAPTIDLDEERRERGKVFCLVVGRVQSGKTRNYSGLIFKAFDEGWNTVIVLTSDRTTLADQTMERIQNECNDVGLYITAIDFGEGRDIRFNAAGKYIGIAQKNVNHLRNIEQWLERIAEADKEKVSLLVIDDESDNATPDTQQSSSYVLTEADIDCIALNFPSNDEPVGRHVSEWIRSLGGLDASSRVIELGMAGDEAAADAVVDEAARDVANATTQAAMVDLLRDRNRNVAKILGIDREVDVGNGQLRWLNELVVEKMNNRRNRRHQYDNNRILVSLVQYVFEVRVARSRINHLVATMFSNGGNIGGPDKYRFGKMAYVSYTATPFANILNENPKLDPLAPDFMYPMQTSRHYIGMSRIFGSPSRRHDTDTNMSIVREIDDAELSIVRAIQEDEESVSVTSDLTVSWEDVDPDNPEQVIQCREEWQSLRDAIAWLFCAAAARRLRRIRVHPDSRKLSHRWTTMLFNIGIDQDLHKFLRDKVVSSYMQWIEEHQDEFIEACQHLWCGEDDDGNVNTDGRPLDFTLADFNEACNGYGEIEDYPMWSEIEGHLRWFVNAHMVGNVHCIVANGSRDGIEGMCRYRDVDMTYSYDSDDHIWILCGGYTMSRGLTLDGLVVSYVDRMRKDSAVDTLIQIGRWFGYREGYELLPRVWMSGASIEEYKKMAFTEEALHRDLKHNFDMGFSPKSGDHYARVIKFGRRLSGRSAAETTIGQVDGSFDIFNTFLVNTRHSVLDCVRHFAIDELGLDNQMNRPVGSYAAQGERIHRYHKYPYWRGVDSEQIEWFLSRYEEFAPDEEKIAIGALRDEIKAIPQKWDVVFSDAMPRGQDRNMRFQISDGLSLGMSNTPCTNVANGGLVEFGKFSGDNIAFFSGVKTSAIVHGEIDLCKEAITEDVDLPAGWDENRVVALFRECELSGYRNELPPEIRASLLGSKVRMTSKEYRSAVFQHVDKPDPDYDSANPILQIALVRPPDDRGIEDVETPFAAVSFFWPNHNDSRYSYVAAGAEARGMEDESFVSIDEIRVKIDECLQYYGFMKRRTLRKLVGYDVMSDEKLDIALGDGRTRYAAINPNLSDCLESHIVMSTIYSKSWLAKNYGPRSSVVQCFCKEIESRALIVLMKNGGFAECGGTLWRLMNENKDWRYLLECVWGELDDLFFAMDGRGILSRFHIGERDGDGREGWVVDKAKLWELGLSSAEELQPHERDLLDEIQSEQKRERDECALEGVSIIDDDAFTRDKSMEEQE